MAHTWSEVQPVGDANKGWFTSSMSSDGSKIIAGVDNGRIYLGTEETGQNLTLTCAAGSYSLTGTDAALTYTGSAQNLTLSCGAGSLALTGSACTLSVKRNYVLSCSAGSYAVTGTSASLTQSLVMACESGGAYPNIVVSGAGTTEYNGAYAETGTKNGYPRYIKPYANPRGGLFIVNVKGYGAYTWVISAAGLDSDQNIQIAGGARYYSEDDVATPDLVTNWIQSQGALPLPTVTSSPATSYALTGSSVTLTKSLVLSCETGSYTLTGTDVSFGNTKAYELVCGAGSYALTGSDIAFVIARSYSLTCNAGSYTLTGAAVTLAATHTYTLACNSGSYLLTGTNAALTSARSLTCNSGAYTLTGLEADLFKGLVLPCGNGSYILTGKPASITSGRTFALGMGSYVLVGTDAGLYILPATPDCRTYFIDAENRTHTIDAENRTMEVRCH